MTIKRAILALLTILAIAQIGLSLKESFSQPQIQSRLELYQTNLVLQVAEFTPPENSGLDNAVSTLIGAKPYAAAQQKYQQVQAETAANQQKIQTQLKKLQSESANDENQKPSTNPPEIKQLQQQIAELGQFIDELELKQGILKAVDGNPQEAIALWQQEIERINNPQNRFSQTAALLQQLWQQQAPQQKFDLKLVQNNLDSWFRYQTLAKLNQAGSLGADFRDLAEQEQQAAASSIFKLALIGGIPVLGGISGVLIFIALLIQRWGKPEQALLATNGNLLWETPWDGETIWQVLIVGFFFVGQFVLPLTLGLFNFNPAHFSLRIKALYVLSSYILMALGGITVLYLSLKSYLPLPSGWFKVKWRANWLIWGVGGYLVAIPLVLLVSWINQLIWHGQGGSNPLLYLALQAQDQVALTIFFITASIAAPIYEEIMFRGFLLPSLTRYLPVTGAIVVSGLIFAIAHLSLSEVLPLTTLGIVLGFVYTRSRNLLAPMLLHCLWNSGTLISLFVLGSQS